MARDGNRLPPPILAPGRRRGGSVLVVHGAWLVGTGLAVWAEDSTRPTQVPRRPGRAPRRTPAPLRRRAGRRCPRCSATTRPAPRCSPSPPGPARRCTPRSWSRPPSRNRSAARSPSPAGGSPSSGTPRTTPSTCCVPSTGSTPWSGPTLRHLAELADFAADLVARGRLLPGVPTAPRGRCPGRPAGRRAARPFGAVRRVGGRLGGVATPAHRHGCRLGPVAGARPAPGRPGRRRLRPPPPVPVPPRAGRPGRRPAPAEVPARCRCHRRRCRAGPDGAGALVADALDAAHRCRRPGGLADTDAGPGWPARRRGGRPGWPRSPARSGGSPPTRPRWPPSAPSWTPGSATPPAARCGPVSGWSSRPSRRDRRRPDRGARRPVDRDRTGRRWRLEFGAAGRRRAEPARRRRDRSGGPRQRSPALAGRWHDPQETLLAELGRASRLYPELDDALRTARPERAGARRRRGPPVPPRRRAGAGRRRVRGAAAVAGGSRPSARLGARLHGHARRTAPGTVAPPRRARPGRRSSTTAGTWPSATSRSPPTSWPAGRAQDPAGAAARPVGRAGPAAAGRRPASCSRSHRRADRRRPAPARPGRRRTRPGRRCRWWRSTADGPARRPAGRRRPSGGSTR